MKELSEKDVEASIQNQFQDWFGFSSNEVKFEAESEASESDRPDFKLTLPDETFIVEYIANTETDRIWSTFDEIRSWTKGNRAEALLFVVPYMPENAKETFNEHGISWMDLSGNAHIEEPSFYVHVEGKKNQFQRPGPRRSVFAPKTSMVPMKFLLNPKKSFTVKQLAEDTGLDPSTVSRATRRLKSLGFIREEEKKGRSKPYELLNPNTMLDAWTEDYDFSKHDVVKGALAETGNRGFLGNVKNLISSYTGQYALSGPRVAQFHDIPGESPLVIAYVKELPSQIDLEKMEFKPGDRGANLWLVRPSSRGPFMGTEKNNDIKIVNRIQVYLDLASIKAQRSEELAEELYKQIKKDFRDVGF